MSDLRERCIEAMARQVEQRAFDWPITDEVWATYKTTYPEEWVGMLADAKAALDALLAVLADHADEWSDWNAAECADADEVGLPGEETE